MELNALTRWNSIGTRLGELGLLKQHLERMEKLSKVPSAELDKQGLQRGRPSSRSREALQARKAKAEHESPSSSPAESGTGSRNVSPLRTNAGQNQATIGEATHAPSGAIGETLPPASGQTNAGSIEPVGSRVHALARKFSDADTDTDRDEAISQSTVRREMVALSKLDDQLTKEIMPPPVHYALRRFGKGFLVGYLGKSLFMFLPMLVRTRGNLFKLAGGMNRVLFGDSVRYGFFLGTFLTTFESIMRFMRAKQLLSRADRAMIAGGSAGLLALWFVPKSSRVGMCCFFLVRAVEIMCRRAWELGWLPRKPAFLWNHMDTLVMAVASTQVIWSWLFRPNTLDESYKHFLDHHGGKQHAQMDAFVALNNGPDEVGVKGELLERLQALRLRTHLPPLDPSSPRVFCEMLHPDSTSCFRAYVHFGAKAFIRSLPVYIPVYLIPLIVFRVPRMLNKPLSTNNARILANTVLSIARSSLFLAWYCSNGWYATCTARNVLGSEHYANGCFSGFMCGTMVFVEKRSRRIELALYVLSHAVQSFVRLWHMKGVLPTVPNVEIVAFSLSMAVIMHAYINHPALLRTSYFSLLTFFFGSGGQAAGFPNKESSGHHKRRKHDRHVEAQLKH